VWRVHKRPKSGKVDPAATSTGDGRRAGKGGLTGEGGDVDGDAGWEGGTVVVVAAKPLGVPWNPPRSAQEKGMRGSHLWERVEGAKGALVLGLGG
jgi:hypothetical protein